MSGLMIVRYNSLPTNLLYTPGLDGNFPWNLLNFKFRSIGTLLSLQADIPASFKTSNAYFRKHKVIPLSDLATSRPRKYFKPQRSLS